MPMNYYFKIPVSSYGNKILALLHALHLRVLAAYGSACRVLHLDGGVVDPQLRAELVRLFQHLLRIASLAVNQ
jgi:hypothetical protein